MSDSKLGQGLPRLDEAHLGLDQTHLGHVLVGFQDPGGNLRNKTIVHVRQELLSALPLKTPTATHSPLPARQTPAASKSTHTHTDTHTNQRTRLCRHPDGTS